jgi:ATPase subunit of ABC transporter with duplicated ATPase domains
MAQYIYTMSGVGKVVPPQTEILKNISLNFFPGAKIGVLGYNGSGKSTLLRIMAGVDTEHTGEARPQTGIRIGYLAQEPELDNSLDVRGNVELGVAESKALLDQFNTINMKFAEPMSDDEMNPAPGSLSASSILRQTLFACRPGTHRSNSYPVAKSGAWRCASCCCRIPTC